MLTLDAMRGDVMRDAAGSQLHVCPTIRPGGLFGRRTAFWCRAVQLSGLARCDNRRPPGAPAGAVSETVSRARCRPDRADGGLESRGSPGGQTPCRRWVRLDFGLADDCVNAYVSRGLGLDLQLFMPYGDGSGPVLDEYAGATDGAIYPLKEKPYRHYIRKTVRRYGRHAAFFQIGNEPGNPHQYSGTAEQYVGQVRQAVDEIRRVTPGIPITNGGYCFDNDDTRRIASGVRDSRLRFVPLARRLAGPEGVSRRHRAHAPRRRLWLAENSPTRKWATTCHGRRGAVERRLRDARSCSMLGSR